MIGSERGGPVTEGAAPDPASASGKPRAASGGEEVYGKIRDLIVGGALRSGEIVSQVSLAERLGVSRTPVREALRRLQAEGLLDARHNHRMRVSMASPDEIDALYASRIFLEGMGVALTVGRMTDDDLEELQEASRRIPWEANAGQEAANDNGLFEFKCLAMKHAGSGVLEAVKDYWFRCERIRRAYVTVTPGSTLAGRDEHFALVRAFLARSVDDAVFVVTRHLGRTALAVLSYMDPDYEPRAIRFALSQSDRPVVQTMPRPLLNVVGDGPMGRRMAGASGKARASVKRSGS